MFDPSSRKFLSNAVVLVAILGASSAAVSASNQKPAKCLAGMRTALLRGHFSGPLLCSKKDASFVLVGRTAGDKYSIYDYRYRYLPANGSVMHGGQRIVVFHGKTYAGQYVLSPPPYITVAVIGTDIEFRTTDISEKVEVDLSRAPPKTVLVSGEEETFFR